MDQKTRNKICKNIRKELMANEVHFGLTAIDPDKNTVEFSAYLFSKTQLSDFLCLKSVLGIANFDIILEPIAELETGYCYCEESCIGGHDSATGYLKIICKNVKFDKWLT